VIDPSRTFGPADDRIVERDGTVYVEMILTAPCCPVAGSLPGEVEKAIRTGHRRRARQAGLDAALDARPHEQGSPARARAAL